MLNQATMDMLTAMKLTAMAAEFANQLKDPTFNELGFEERLGLLVNAELSPSPKTDRKQDKKAE